ncbi:hypothetical protein ACFQZE_18630 [Paenibacillus sp. GCM10027627]|uniref:hypothetical protein n=1 Tax=unclassified Paenibacillus TaxID=185978 RepID=UPI0036305D0B
MSNSSGHKKWLDDYLDLYNFAGGINDKQWQEQILQIMRSGPSEQQDQQEDNDKLVVKDQLWREFNDLNHKLLELFSIIKSSLSSYEIESTKYMIQSLKQRRLEVGRRLL